MSDGARERAFQELFEKVYDELKSVARRSMRNERQGHSLYPTDLVHEVYLRLFTDDATVDFRNRAHFFGAVGQAMRRILVDHARRRASGKRGGDRERVRLTLIDAALPENPQDLLALDEALLRLERKDPRAAEVVRLRYFAGLTIDQTADAMQLSSRTVKREWEFARAWLMKQMQ